MAGVGDDILNLLVPRSGDGVVPETNLDVLGRSQIRLECGEGDDRIIGQLTPHVARSGPHCPEPEPVLCPNWIYCGGLTLSPRNQCTTNAGECE
jgi:hypothetical protein